MRIIVNGDPLDISNVENLRELLRELHIEPSLVAVEVNLSVVKKAAYSTYLLKEGDRVEIVKFVGGG